MNNVLSGVERTGPPDGGPARVAPTVRVAAGGAWQTANRRISRRIIESVATDLSQRRGLAKSVWQASAFTTEGTVKFLFKFS